MSLSIVARCPHPAYAAAPAGPAGAASPFCGILQGARQHAHQIGLRDDTHQLLAGVNDSNVMVTVPAKTRAQDTRSMAC